MTRQKAKKEIEAALSALSADPSMGYLAVTSKPELPVRDRVAWHFHKKHRNLFAAREYPLRSKRNLKLRKRVDLALLGASLDPVVLVEFKAMIVPDPLVNSEHELMRSLADDLERLARISRVPRFGVMLMVHIENVEQLTEPMLNGRVVKFLSNFRRRAKKPDVLKNAIRITSEFYRPTFKVSPLTIELGSVWGARVKLISFIIERR
jgi:hypothetical protein